MYKIEQFQNKIKVKEYLEHYVDIPCFLEYCKACERYDKSWACPPYDFSVEDYWKQYEVLYVVGSKLIFDQETLGAVSGKEDVERVLNEVLVKEKGSLSQWLYEIEAKYPGSKSLSAGSCMLCEACQRPEGKPCQNPEIVRYSIESLGGNVGKTCSKLMGIDLIWSQEGKLPAYFTLVNGLLSNEEIPLDKIFCLK